MSVLWTDAYAERFRKQRWAYYKVREALGKGQLTRKQCERKSDRCFGRIEAHHEDYDRPLDVTWLCRRHHLDRHAELRKVAA